MDRKSPQWLWLAFSALLPILVQQVQLRGWFPTWEYLFPAVLFGCVVTALALLLQTRPAGRLSEFCRDLERGGRTVVAVAAMILLAVFAVGLFVVVAHNAAELAKLRGAESPIVAVGRTEAHPATTLPLPPSPAPSTGPRQVIVVDKGETAALSQRSEEQREIERLRTELTATRAEVNDLRRSLAVRLAQLEAQIQSDESARARGSLIGQATPPQAPSAPLGVRIVQ